MKIDKRTNLIIVATVLLAGLAIFTAWRLYQLRSQAVAPTAPKLVPAQESASCPTVSFPVGGGVGCPVNSTCCRQPLTTCDNTLQCGSGFICYLGYCVKQTYDPNTNTCPAAGAPPPREGSGGDDGGGPAQVPGPVGVGTPASPSPSPSPRASPSPSPTASPRAGATPSPSPGQAAPGTSTSAPSGTSAASATSKATAAAASPKSLPEAGISWPTLGAVGGGILFLILGILLAF